jgi:hypothetical protein
MLQLSVISQRIDESRLKRSSISIDLGGAYALDAVKLVLFGVLPQLLRGYKNMSSRPDVRFGILGGSFSVRSAVSTINCRGLSFALLALR